ncbi:hypothetical protein [Acidovorax sp. PRC11]|uniref:hypothetical protein n=1 Tax=Acidovorax sp. PRC11 TaxID=2962592 RepID=UPI00288294E0|nr:hypothetical protein [Acidovorax sp. PRC11]MDT0137405.1 hypothetical protein [Acidovorax sp. PRC11]
MAAPQSPFSFLDGLFERLAGGPQPPQWLVHEVQHRLVLLVNHVLMQEPEAMERLVRQSGSVARVQWRAYSMALRVTPAGLFDLAGEAAVPDLRVEITDTSPLSLAQTALRGARPAIRIEGDVQLAAEIQWLADHVRWDLEEDLARIIGDAPAHAIGTVARRVAQALKQFVGMRMAAGRPAPDDGPQAGAPGSDRGAP